jgi:hypothetical protein
MGFCFVFSPKAIPFYTFIKEKKGKMRKIKIKK